MPKKDGEKTKMRILKVAEKLFSENGFDGTSIDKIAKKAGVNKALIYYYFKNKNDIIVSLFRNIIDEFNEKVDHPTGTNIKNMHGSDEMEAVKRGEIEFLDKRKKIISILFMEAFKSHDKNHFLFQCAELIINNERKGLMEKYSGLEKVSLNKDQFFIFEFFTGFIPLLTFVILKDKWCKYFNCDSQKALEYFLESFEKTHMASHTTDYNVNSRR
ncbi:TetR/AcrR family transcriptional regulator [Thermodesulfobacteriota bacterium]